MPFWSLKLDGKMAIFQQVDASFEMEADRIDVEEIAEDTRRVEYIRNNAPFLTVTRIDQTCVDHASGQPRPYELMVQTGEQHLRGCGGDLAGLMAESTWLVEDLNDRGVIDRAEPRLRFQLDGAIEIFTGCSTYSAAYRVMIDKLIVGTPQRSEEACLIPSLEKQEARLLAILSSELDVRGNEETGLITISGQNGRGALSRVNRTGNR